MRSVIEYKPVPVSLPLDGKLFRIFKSTKSHISGVERLDESDYPEYETHIIFYDIFFDESGKKILISAPPLLNLEKSLLPFKIYNNRDEIINRKIKIKNYERSSFIEVELNQKLESNTPHKLKIVFNNGLIRNVTIERKMNLPPVFVQMTTLQKNNPVSWIKDWIEYHDRQGVNRFLIYDNGSTNYEDMKQMLVNLEVTSELVLINWPYKYGTLRNHRNKFCPNAQRNHSIHHFNNAEWTGFFDIDEFFSAKQFNSATDMLKSQGKLVGAVRIDNYIVPDQQIEAQDNTEISYRNFEWREKEAKGKAYKYFLRHSAHREAKTHNAKLKIPYIKITPKPEQCHFLHFRGLNTNWKASNGVASEEKQANTLEKITQLD